MRAAFVLGAAALLLAGCSSAADTSTPDPSGTQSSEFVGLASSALDDARATGASDAQLALIDAAVTSGEVPFDAVEQALDATFACFEAAGVRYEKFAPSVRNGIPYPSYSFEGEGKTAIADECIHVNSDYIEALYMRQPAAVEANDAIFRAAMPAIIECLAGLGIEVDPDITVDELQQILLPTEEEVTGPNEKEALKRIRCAGDNGVDSF